MNLPLQATASPAWTTCARALAWLPRVLTRFLGVGAGACLAVALTACGGGSDGGSANSGDTTVSTTLDASGGAVTLPGGVTVTVPAGALATATTITIKRTSTGAPPEPTALLGTGASLGTVYEITPHDVSFAQPVTIRLPFDSSKGTPTVLVSDLETGWYPHAISAVGNDYIEIQRKGFSWLQVVDHVNTNLSIENPVNMKVNGAAGMQGFYQMDGSNIETYVGMPATARFAAHVDGCFIRELLLEMKIGTTWTVLNQFAGNNSTDGRDVAFVNVAFTPLFAGDYDMRARATCTKDADLRIVDARLSQITWKLPMKVWPTYTLGGTVSGLLDGTSVKLAVNGGAPQTVAANGSFTFDGRLAASAAYTVAVAEAPAQQVCTVGNASGTVGSSDIGNVTVQCTGAYRIGGFVTGLPNGASVTLLLNGANGQTVTNNSGVDGDMVTFMLNQAVATGAPYEVTVGSVSPASHACSVSGGTGIGGSQDLSNAFAVDCYPAGPFTIGGGASGLGSGGPYPSLVFTLTNTSGVQSTRTLPLTGAGAFSLTGVAGGQLYSAAVETTGTAYTCSVSTNPTATFFVDSNKTDLTVSCN